MMEGQKEVEVESRLSEELLSDDTNIKDTSNLFETKPESPLVFKAHPEDNLLPDLLPGDTKVFSRGEAIALWVGVILFVALLSCVFYRLCRVTVQTLIQNMRPAGRQKKLNPQEKKVNKILSNQNAREILKSRAITAINSQASRSRRGYSSQLSLTSTGTVPDLTDRVIRVSFAPEVRTCFKDKNESEDMNMDWTLGAHGYCH